MLPTQLQEILDRLPEEVRQAINESNYDAIASELADTHELSPAQKKLLPVETLFVLAGLESAADFAESLEQEAEIPHETARVIANDIGLRVFSPFREKLQALSREASAQSDASLNPESVAPEEPHPGYETGDPYREPIE